jgi:tetratricopeptide (TPR) repeat protein
MGYSCPLYYVINFVRDITSSSKKINKKNEEIFIIVEEMIEMLIDYERRGNSELIYSIYELFIKIEIVKPPDYFYDLMKKLRITRPSFRISASLISYYSKLCLKEKDKKKKDEYVSMMEEATEKMKKYFIINIYLYNVMLNVYRKLEYNTKFWAMYLSIKENDINFQAYTYGTLIEFSLFVDRNPRKAEQFYEECLELSSKDIYVDYDKQNVEYIKQLGLIIKSMKQSQLQKFEYWSNKIKYENDISLNTTIFNSCW